MYYNLDYSPTSRENRNIERRLLLKKSTLKFSKSIGCSIPFGSIVKVKKMNNIVEISYVEKKNHNMGLNFVKLSKEQYLNKVTGEILNYQLSENRLDNKKSLSITFRKIRDLINNNFTGNDSEVHLTLTYAAAMTDEKKAQKDFEKFWKKFKYRYGDNFEYISIIEPQGDGKKYGNEWHAGTWHFHVLIKTKDNTTFYVPILELVDIWGHGKNLKIKSLGSIDNIGAYLSAYLGDIELNDDISTEMPFGSEIVEKLVDGEKKKFVKGGRLNLYPPGMNLYRKSSGILHPDIDLEVYEDIKKVLGSNPKYSSTVCINSDDGALLNTICYEQYNLKCVDSATLI